MTKKENPEALAKFAEAARSEDKKDKKDKKDNTGSNATKETKPIPTDSKLKDEAATKVLQEGVTGEDHGAEEAIEELPDRIIESRE